MGIIKNDILWIAVIDEKNDKMYIHEWQEIVSLIYKNSKTFRNLPSYKYELFEYEYKINLITQEDVIITLFEDINKTEDQEECEFNIFDEYKFKLKVVRFK